MDVKFIVSGIQLENGVKATTDIIAWSLRKAGGEIVVDPDYLSTIHGGKAGTAYYQVRVSEKPLLSSGDEIADALVALELGRENGRLPLAAANYLSKIRPGGFLLFDSTYVGEVVSEKFVAVPVPAHEIVKSLYPTESPKKIMLIRNSVLVGALFELFGFDNEKIATQAAFLRQFATKKDVAEKNLAAFDAGRTYIRGRTSISRGESIIFPAGPSDRLFLTGNDAMVISALDAGLAFYAGYPITPASPILELLEKRGREFGIAVRQLEDEIAAAMAVMGAFYGGANAFTATSGPGFSLMTEAIGHAGITEIPLVIVDVQRAGPSTGMPTKTEQGDLNVAIFAHQEIPKLVFAPGDVTECFEIMPRAFYLARKYQLPVIILTSLDIAEGVYTTEKFNLDYANRFDTDWHPQEKAGEGALHARYAVTPNGISPAVIPGEPNKIFRATGTEHDELGFVNTRPEIRRAMMDKRLRKLKTFLDEDFEPPIVSGSDVADIALIGWGATKGVIQEARERLENQGLRVKTVHFQDLWPLRPSVACAQANSANKVFVVEGNATGQFAAILRSKAAEAGVALTSDRFMSLTRYDGRPFEPRIIVEKVLAEVSHG